MNKNLIIILFLIALNSVAQDSTKVLVPPRDTVNLFLLGANEIIVEKSKNILQGAENQLFIAKFDSLFAKDFDKDIQYKALLSANVDTWEMGLYDKRKIQINFLKSYKNANLLTPDFKKFVENNIRWNYWHLLFSYAVLRSNIDTKATRLTSLPTVMTEELDLKKVNDDFAFLSKPYRDFLPFFITYYNSQEQAFQKYADQVKSISDKGNLAQKYLKGDILDYSLTKILYDNCGRLTSSVTKYWISQISSESYQKILKEHCAETLNRKEEVAKKKDEKTKDTKSEYPLLTDLKGKKFAIEDFKGKVVYVDFWASWCGPCRQMFPYSAKMHESLTEKQKKKVVFLYISIDEDEANWKNAVEKIGMKGEHGHSGGGWESEIVRKFKINSIPRYMIINPKGEFVLPDAPRPSDEEAMQEILKLIE